MIVSLTRHHATQSIPYELLLLADPYQSKIDEYLSYSKLYIAYTSAGDRVGACVVTDLSKNAWEILNLAVEEACQRQGVGKQIITQIVHLAQTQHIQKLWVATGNSSIGQLVFYQKSGFEMHTIVPNYFIDHYPEEIVENGIVCKHQVRLVYCLSKNQ
ncbi:GNAT family N-acetyltransferase [Microscilla marina]|uniref:Acetyltransferase, gnat family n=1 Tax=Microscilla marina ATCC 23134 TaxID=313606 RepID=A1ZEV5_MICM2|nr:GNAT family N-acetyltransferase [Microscilla marina]EAY31057.1 acetyltransferase, gnat family [Microscilla marina ATCC 23134]